MVERVTVAAADGNPLYLEQMLQMLIDDGAIRNEGGRWVVDRVLLDLEVPPTIAALLTARLDRLGRSERTVIERGAVVGQVFYRGAVEALVPPPLQPEVAHALKALSVKELISPHEESLIGQESVQVPPRADPRRRVRRPPEADARGAPRGVRRLGGIGGGRPHPRVRGDPRVPPRAGVQIRSELGVPDVDVETLGRRAART